MTGSCRGISGVPTLHFHDGKINSSIFSIITPPRSQVLHEWGQGRRNCGQVQHYQSQRSKTPPATFPNLSMNPKGLPNAKRRYTASPPSRLSPEKSSVNLNNLYAGPKFVDPPSPTSLPKPPQRWMPSKSEPSGKVAPEKLFGNAKNCWPKPQNCAELTNHLKLLLKVQA